MRMGDKLEKKSGPAKSRIPAPILDLKMVGATGFEVSDLLHVKCVSADYFSLGNLLNNISKAHDCPLCAFLD